MSAPDTAALRAYHEKFTAFAASRDVIALADALDEARTVIAAVESLADSFAFAENETTQEWVADIRRALRGQT